jgi:prepilin-type N-terminal cleavage/methylation domain-containing protein
MRNQKGFTLIELMVVMAVASIIMGTSVPLITKVMGKIQASNTITTFKKIEAKAKEYYNSLYPSPAWPTNITQILPSGAVNKNNWGYQWNIAVNGSNLEISTQVPAEWESAVKNGLPTPFVSISGGVITYTVEPPGQTADLTTINNRITALENKPAIPAGTVAYFNLSSCPSEWSELTNVRGRYIVGLPSGGTLAGTQGTALSNLEDRPVGYHNHGVSDPWHSHGVSDPGHRHQNFYREYASSGCCNYWSMTESSDRGYGWQYTQYSTTGITIASSPTGIAINFAGSISGTNAPYIQFLVCQKN